MNLPSTERRSITTPKRTPYAGPQMDFQVMGRDDMRGCNPDRPHLIISIWNTIEPRWGADVIEMPDQCVRLLALRFDDIDDSRNGFEPMDARQAAHIVEVVKRHRNDVRLIVCQCEAGVSRSAGVAAALSEWLNGDAEWAFRDFSPNQHVYALVGQAVRLAQADGLE